MENESEKTLSVFRTEDGKIYKIKDLVLAIATIMSRDGYVQPFCVFLDMGFFHSDDLLQNAYQHFFVDNPNKLTKSVPYKQIKNKELNQWINIHGDGVEV